MFILEPKLGQSMEDGSVHSFYILMCSHIRIKFWL